MRSGPRSGQAMRSPVPAAARTPTPTRVASPSSRSMPGVLTMSSARWCGTAADVAQRAWQRSTSTSTTATARSTKARPAIRPASTSSLHRWPLRYRRVVEPPRLTRGSGHLLMQTRTPAVATLLAASPPYGHRGPALPIRAPIIDNSRTAGRLHPEGRAGRGLCQAAPRSQPARGTGLSPAAPVVRDQAVPRGSAPGAAG